MGTKTLLDRIIDLETQVQNLSTVLNDRLKSVILVEQRKPGPVPKLKKHRIIKDIATSERMKARWEKWRREKDAEKFNTA